MLSTIGSFNKASLAAIAPPLTAILLTIDKRAGWELGAEFWGAVLAVVFFILTAVIPNIRPQGTATRAGDTAADNQGA